MITPRVYLAYMVFSIIVLIGQVVMAIIFQSRITLVIACALLLTLGAVSYVYYRQEPRR